MRPRAIDQFHGKIYKPEVAQEMERRGTMVGEILSVGHNAWKGFGDGRPWAKEGDTVFFSRYAGVDVPDDIKVLVDPTADRLVFMNDEDVIGVVRKASEEKAK